MKLLRILTCIWCLALSAVLLVSVRPCSEFVFLGLRREGRRGGAYLFSFFFFTDYTENAGVLTSGLVCSLASNMQYCSNLLLLECIVTRLEYDSKLYFPKCLE